MALSPEAVAKEEQRRRIKEAEAARAEVTAEGLAKSGATGVRETAEGTVGLGGDLPGMAGSGAKWIIDQTAGRLPQTTGYTPEKAEEFGKSVEGAVDTGVKAASGQYGVGYIIKKALEEAGLLTPEQAAFDAPNVLPSSQDVHGAVSSVLPEGVEEATTHEAQNTPESLAQFAGNMAPGMGGKIQGAKRGMDILKALMQRLGTRVALPAVGQEAATQGTDELVKRGAITPETATGIKMLVGFATGMGSGMLERSGNVKAAASIVGRDPQAIRIVYDAIRADVGDDAAALAKLDQMGLDSRLLDLGPNTQQQAQIAQTAPGEGKAGMINFLEDRASREPGMVKDIREEAFGPEVNRDTVRGEIEDRVSRERREYEPAHARQVKPVDAQSLIDDIDTRLGREKDKGMRQHLQDVKDSMYIHDRFGTVTGTVDPSSSGLLSARRALRNKLYNDDGSPKQLGSEEGPMLKEMYGEINKAMGEANPDIRDIDKKISDVRQEGRAFEEGSDVLKRGDEARSGAEYEPVWNSMTPEQQTKTVQGVSRWIDQQVDMSSTDRAKLKSIVGSTWNKQKLETMVGPEKTAKLLEGLETVDTFRDSYQKIVHGSRTANLQQPGKGGIMEGVLPDAALTTGLSGSLEAGASVGAARAGRNWLRNKLADSMASDRVKNDMAKLLSSDDPKNVLKAAMLLKSADKKSAMPQAMLQALVGRFAEGHR